MLRTLSLTKSSKYYFNRLNGVKSILNSNNILIQSSSTRSTSNNSIVSPYNGIQSLVDSIKNHYYCTSNNSNNNSTASIATKSLKDNERIKLDLHKIPSSIPAKPKIEDIKQKKDEVLEIEIEFKSTIYRVEINSPSDVQLITLLHPDFIFQNFGHNLSDSERNNMFVMTREGRKIPNIKKISELKEPFIIISGDTYSNSVQTITNKQIFIHLYNKKGKELVDANEVEEFIDSFINELAITAPKLLNDIKLNNSLASKSWRFLEKHVIDYNKAKNNKKMNTIDGDFDFTSLSEPYQWFPLARKMKRHFILHVGPTNSGKTYRALKRLMESESGVYCSPLRLLAQEVYDKFIAAGVPCSLETGQIKIIDDNASHSSCTIEIANIDKMIECAVIDEYQMISDIHRGSAWTKAILGLPASEIHLCGDNTCIQLINNICEVTGDKVTINNYERLSPLVPSSHLPGLEDIKSGDCIVGFSRIKLLQLRAELEGTKYKKKCAVVYGALPPSTRYQQAMLFNEGHYDVLLASDAIGMGLNLNIKRIVFSKITKFDGDATRTLYPGEIKQIAGRAGRYKEGIKEPGFVTSFTLADFKIITKALSFSNVIFERAGIFPQPEQLEIYSKLPKFENEKFSKVVESFIERIEIGSLYFLESFDKKLEVLKVIDNIPLPTRDKYNFMMAPFNSSNKSMPFYLRAYATRVSNGETVPHLVSLPDPPRGTRNQTNEDKWATYMERLESNHNILDSYLWLSNRYQSFYQTVDAYKLLLSTSDLISKTLSEFNSGANNNKRSHRRLRDSNRGKTDKNDNNDGKDKKYKQYLTKNINMNNSLCIE